MGAYQSNTDTKPNNTMESDEECFHDAEDELNAKDMNGQQYLKNFQIDAIQSRRPHITNPKIQFETLRDIERELTFYEKVSLAFLLFEQADITLQSLLVEQENLIQQSTINFLLEWAHSDNLWKNKIIEGLAIIQNYSLLERLGYNKEDIKENYLPTNPYTSININILNKALYCFVESLTIQEIQLFLDFLESDFKKKGFRFIKFGDIYTEMYLLQCYSVKYINKNDISNIISILKKNNLTQQMEMLETVSRNSTIYETPNENITKKKLNAVEQTKKNNIVCDFDLSTKFNNSNINAATSGSCSDHSVINRASLVKTCPIGKRYEIDKDNVGICLIINQYEFYVDKDHPSLVLAPKDPLQNREGTNIDRDKLKNTFKKYNFQIKIKDNLTDLEIENAIRNEMSIFSTKDSCFIVCILSHGQQDSVFGVNSIPVDICHLEDILHDTAYPALLGKPKILIIQSCQGKGCQKIIVPKFNYVTDGPSSNNPPSLSNEMKLFGPGVPQKIDLLLLMSTVTGFASIRDPKQGTWFIQELCNLIDEESDENHIEDIMTTVIAKVSSKRWPKEDGIVTMVPQKKSTFSKKLFLTKIHK